MEFERLEKIVGTEWAHFLKGFMCPDASGKCPYDTISAQLKDMYKAENGKPIYPAAPDLWNAFRATKFEDVRVVILGQDPYFKPGLATGVAFATPGTVPPSLKMIYNAIERDVYNGLDTQKENRTGVLGRPDETGNTKTWMQQGVLMLNSAFTVPDSSPGEHMQLWRPLLDYIVSNLWRVKNNLIYVGWGSDAKDILKWRPSKTAVADNGVSFEGTGVDVFHAFVEFFEHPSAAARDKREWLCNSFSRINLMIVGNKLGAPIQW